MSEIESALLAEAPNQWARSERQRLKRRKGLPKWQQDVDLRVDELRRRHDPALMQISECFDKKLVVKRSLQCPVCGDSDRGNRMNRKPWCLKCNSPLEPPTMPGQRRIPRMRLLPRRKKLDVTFRGIEE